MSAAIDHVAPSASHDPLGVHPAAPPRRRRLTVAPVPVAAVHGETALRPPPQPVAEQEATDARVAELQRHLANLARRYADDAAEFQRRLRAARAAAEAAQTEVRRANQRAAAAQAETFRLRGDCAFLSERLMGQRIRAGQLEDAATLPWWAVARRRFALRELGLTSR